MPAASKPAGATDGETGRSWAAFPCRITFTQKGGLDVEDVSATARHRQKIGPPWRGFMWDWIMMGTFDLVNHNIDQDAFILHNDSRRHWLTLQLEGDPKNLRRHRRKAIVYTRQTAIAESYPVRRLRIQRRPPAALQASAHDPRLADVIWPDDRGKHPPSKDDTSCA